MKKQANKIKILNRKMVSFDELKRIELTPDIKGYIATCIPVSGHIEGKPYEYIVECGNTVVQK